MDKFIYQTKIKTGKTVSFRYPTIDDLQILTDFINKASKEKTFISFQGEKFKLEDERKWLEKTIEKIKKKEKIYIMAFIDNQFVGSSDIELAGMIRGHVGIFGIVVDSEFRGHGVGKLLMGLVIKEAIKNIKGLKIITLECFAENKVAIGLYKKMGFVEFGRLPKGLKRKGKFSDQLFMYLKVK